MLNPVSDRPRMIDQRRCAPVQRQQAGVELDRAERWNRAERLRDELRDESHHADIGVCRPQRRQGLGVGQPREGMGRHACSLAGEPQRIGAALFRGAEHGADGIAAGQERLEHGLAEGLLADDCDANDPPPWCEMTACSADCCCVAR